MSAWTYSASNPTLSSTRTASGSTTLPIPSPGIETIVLFAIVVLLRAGTTATRRSRAATEGGPYARPSLRATRFSIPPATTSDCGTLPSAGKANVSPR